MFAGLLLRQLCLHLRHLLVEVLRELIDVLDAVREVVAPLLHEVFEARVVAHAVCLEQVVQVEQTRQNVPVDDAKFAAPTPPPAQAAAPKALTP